MNYSQHFRAAIADLKSWLDSGKIKHKEHVLTGLSQCPAALRMLFTGENRGKMLVQLTPSARL